MQQAARRNGFLVVLTALVACEGSAGRRDATAPVGGSGLDAATSDGGVAPGPGPAADAAGPVVDAAPAETGTVELPRLPADPQLTRKLAPGPSILLGGDGTSCSRGGPAAPDRWCAFARQISPAATELWVVNVTKAAAGTAVACDGSSADCRRLSSHLWTGTSFWGASHPAAHRFEEDTLIFHADAPASMRQVYEGPIWAWRPGWPAPRKLTSDHGVQCFAQPRSNAIGCIDNAVIDKDPVSPFERPRLREFDLLAGIVTDTTAGPLAKVAPVSNQAAELAFRVRFSPHGDYLAFSSVAAPGQPETLQLIKTADVGRVPPATIRADVAEWEIAHDGAKLYYLTGFDRSRGDRAVGTLMLADFPDATNPVELKTSVFAFELLGSHDQVVSEVDKGLFLAYGSPDSEPKAGVLRDRAEPAELLTLVAGAEGIHVATDARHTLFFRQLRDSNFPVAFVARNDGSGHCQLTADILAESYGGHFSDSGRAVFWIEFGRNQSNSEEGWYARPESCGERIKFGDYVFGYRLVGDDFVVFEGGDAEDTTSWLQYNRLQKTPSAAPVLPRVIKEHPDPTRDIVQIAGQTWVVFSVSMGAAGETGLYLHGPLEKD